MKWHFVVSIERYNLFGIELCKWRCLLLRFAKCHMEMQKFGFVMCKLVGRVCSLLNNGKIWVWQKVKESLLVRWVDSRWAKIKPEFSRESIRNLVIERVYSPWLHFSAFCSSVDSLSESSSHWVRTLPETTCWESRSARWANML